jgi:hypothetical protein
MTAELVAVVEKTVQLQQNGLWIQPAVLVGTGHPRSPAE